MNNEKLAGFFKKGVDRREFLGLIGLGTGVGLAYLFGRRESKSVASEGQGFQYEVYIPLVTKNFQEPLQVKGLCYSPYRDGQNPDWGPYPSEKEIETDIGILDPIVNHIRTYGSDHNSENIPRFIKERGSNIKINAGCWLGSDPAVNGILLNNLVSEVNQNANVISATVGNETQQFGTVTEGQLINYLNLLRQQIRPGVTVATSDTWFAWVQHPSLVRAVDYISAHFFPYWEPEPVPIENAVAFIRDKYNLLRSLYPEKKIVIGEAGWPSGGAARGKAVPTLENQRRFINEFLSWTNQERIDFYLFDAFDEAWKERYEGEVGRHWGIYYSNRTPKHPGLTLK